MNKKKKIILSSILITIVVIVVFCLFSYKKIVGKFSYSSPARDDMFGVSIDSPILIRKVEMVQYCKNEDGTVELVLSNYHINSFDDYINPDFPSDIKSEVFYSEDIEFSGYNLSADVIKEIAYSKSIEKIEATDFQVNDDISEYNLVYTDGSLVTASNEWELGEIKITYSYIDPSKEYIIKSSILNKSITYNPFFNISINNKVK